MPTEKSTPGDIVTMRGGEFDAAEMCIVRSLCIEGMAHRLEEFNFDPEYIRAEIFDKNVNFGITDKTAQTRLLMALDLIPTPAQDEEVEPIPSMPESTVAA